MRPWFVQSRPPVCYSRSGHRGRAHQYQSEHHAVAKERTAMTENTLYKRYRVIDRWDANWDQDRQRQECALAENMESGHRFILERHGRRWNIVHTVTLPPVLARRLEYLAENITV